jgi:Ser/Thr protein kinase RdoA (MazF antagonist)
LFQSIGKAVGKFHTISKSYRPSSLALTRPAWFDSYEIQSATKQLANSNYPAYEKLAKLIIQLKQLPTEPSDYGLIHDDLHFANFLIKPDGQVAIVDFDDCGYGWFAIDVAMALFDVLVLNNSASEAQNQNFARRFMKHYLSGYRQENSLTAFWQLQIPHFLKLKELCIYADLIGHPDIAQPDSWVGSFMRGRAERVANDMPYVDIDFEKI